MCRHHYITKLTLLLSLFKLQLKCTKIFKEYIFRYVTKHVSSTLFRICPNNQPNNTSFLTPYYHGQLLVDLNVLKIHNFKSNCPYVQMLSVFSRCPSENETLLHNTNDRMIITFTVSPPEQPRSQVDGKELRLIERSGSKLSPRTECCVLGQDTLSLRCVSPLTSEYISCGRLLWK